MKKGMMSILALSILAISIATTGCLGQNTELTKSTEETISEESTKRAPAPTIGTISYSTAPLRVGETEKLTVLISESKEINTKRVLKVKATAVRSMGNFLIGETTVELAAGSSSKTVEIGNIKFNTPGTDMKTKVEVFTSTGALLATRTGAYADTIEGNSVNKKVLDVGYYSQPNGVTCGPTSVTMALKYLGKNVTANTIWDVNTRVPSYLQNPANNVAEFQRWGLYSKGTSYGNRDMIIRQIDAGRPVVLHTYLTSGHVVLVVGYDKDRGGFIVNDPNGYYLGYRGGYDKSRSGKGQFISWNDPNLSVITGDTWISTASKTPFTL